MLTADDQGTLQAAAEAGRGIVFLPDFMAARVLRERRLIDALPGWQLVVPEGAIAYALTLPMPESPEAARVLVRFVKEALAVREHASATA